MIKKIKTVDELYAEAAELERLEIKPDDPLLGELFPDFSKLEIKPDDPVLGRFFPKPKKAK